MQLQVISDCNCVRGSRVPKEEASFLIDQRTDRKMMIGGVDVIATVKNKKKQERKEKSLSRNREVNYFNEPCCSRSLTDDFSIESSSSCASSIVLSSSPYHDSEQVKQKGSPPQKKKRLNLPSLALACDRTGVSDRAAAIIASSVLKDVGIISPNDPSRVIDRSKLRRERTKVRLTLQETDCNKYCSVYILMAGKIRLWFVLRKKGNFTENDR